MPWQRGWVAEHGGRAPVVFALHGQDVEAAAAEGVPGARHPAAEAHAAAGDRLARMGALAVERAVGFAGAHGGGRWGGGTAATAGHHASDDLADNGADSNSASRDSHLQQQHL